MKIEKKSLGWNKFENMDVEYRKPSNVDYETMCEKVKETVTSSGFAVLAEIPVSDILKSKGFSYTDMKTYDVCNASYASRALALSTKFESLLPCHISIKRTESGTEVIGQMPEFLARSAGFDPESKDADFIIEVQEKLIVLIDRLAGK